MSLVEGHCCDEPLRQVLKLGLTAAMRCNDMARGNDYVSTFAGPGFSSVRAIRMHHHGRISKP